MNYIQVCGCEAAGCEYFCKALHILELEEWNLIHTVGECNNVKWRVASINKLIWRRGRYQMLCSHKRPVVLPKCQRGQTLTASVWKSPKPERQGVNRPIPITPPHTHPPLWIPCPCLSKQLAASLTTSHSLLQSWMMDPTITDRHGLFKSLVIGFM